MRPAAIIPNTQGGLYNVRYPNSKTTKSFLTLREAEFEKNKFNRQHKIQIEKEPETGVSTHDSTNTLNLNTEKKN